MPPPPSSCADAARPIVEEPVSARPASGLSRGERAHAVALLVAGLGAWTIPSLWLLGGTGAVVFAALLVAERGRIRGGFGLPNWVTSVRLLLTLGLLSVGWIASTTTLAVFGTCILLLDGLDGWLARRFDQASSFGARYDMETDAFFVLALASVLTARETVGPWVLVAGFWRYAYVLILMLWPALGQEPPNRLGRAIFVVLVVGLSLAMVLPAPWASLVAAISTLAVSYSFLRSLWWSYAPLWRKSGG